MVLATLNCQNRCAAPACFRKGTAHLRRPQPALKGRGFQPRRPRPLSICPFSTGPLFSPAICRSERCHHGPSAARPYVVSPRFEEPWVSSPHNSSLYARAARAVHCPLIAPPSGIPPKKIHPNWRVRPLELAILKLEGGREIATFSILKLKARKSRANSRVFKFLPVTPAESNF